MQRRRLLLGLFALAGTACVRPESRPELPPRPVQTLATDEWRAAARSIVLDARATFEVFEQYDVSRASVKGGEGAGQGSVQPPAVADWQRALASVDDLGARVTRLQGAIDLSTPDPAVWRERRVAADAAELLVKMAAGLASYAGLVRHMDLQDNGAGAARVLDQAKLQWRAAAAAWDVPLSN